MNTTNFLQHIVQPCILKFNSSFKLPDNIQNKYVLNLNIGPKSGQDLERVYILISDDFVESDSEFKSWYKYILKHDSIYDAVWEGTENFVPGKDYYINRTLSNKLKELHSYDEEIMPIKNSDVFEDIVIETESQQRTLEDITLPDYTEDWEITNFFETGKFPSDIKYLHKLNTILSREFTEAEILDLISTFFNIIQNDTQIKEETKLVPNNPAYDITMQYYINGKYDDTLQHLLTVLNTKVKTETVPSYNCGCNTTVSDSDEGTTNISCADVYKQSLQSLVVQMLSNPDFYKDWFFMVNDEGEVVPNDLLITELIKLLRELLDMDFDLSFTSDRLWNKCCNNESDSIHLENRNIIKEYIKLLELMKEGCLDDISNRINIIGTKFGNLLLKF